MTVARAKADVGVVDGKIYVFGGHKINEKSSTYGEVFDPKTQIWYNFENIINQEKDNWICNSSVVIDQKVYAMDGYFNFIYYSPNENKWGRSYLLELSKYTSHIQWDWCMSDSILYCLDSLGIIYWFEPDELNRIEPYLLKPIKEVKGLESLKESLRKSKLVHFNEDDVASWNQTLMSFPPRYKTIYVDMLKGARMINYGGNIVLFWDIIEGDHLEIWCAEISMEKRQGGEIWGNILWSNAVMSVDHIIDHYKVSMAKRQHDQIWGKYIKWFGDGTSIDHLIDRYKVLYSVSVTI